MRDRTKLALIGSLMALVACGGSDEGPYPLDPPTDPSAPAPSPSPGTTPPPYPVPGGGTGEPAPQPPAPMPPAPTPPAPGPAPSPTPTPSPPPTPDNNKAPVANAGTNQTGVDGDTFDLDGSASTEPDNDPMTYVWTVLEKPDGSAAKVTNAGDVKPKFKPDVKGTYKIQLEVRDGRGLNGKSEVTITATGPDLTTTSSFANGAQIPPAYGGRTGESNQSPPLTIAGAPSGTKYFAIVMDDQSAACTTPTPVPACVHWNVFNIPKGKTTIASNEAWDLISGVILGASYTGDREYEGPNPPAGDPAHTYKITVYALNADTAAMTATPVPSYSTATFEAKYSKFILSKASLTGTYP